MCACVHDILLQEKIQYIKFMSLTEVQLYMLHSGNMWWIDPGQQLNTHWPIAHCLLPPSSGMGERAGRGKVRKDQFEWSKALCTSRETRSSFPLAGRCLAPSCRQAKCFLGKANDVTANNPPLSSFPWAFIAEHNTMGCGIFLWSLGVVCPRCPPLGFLPSAQGEYCHWRVVCLVFLQCSCCWSYCA